MNKQIRWALSFAAGLFLSATNAGVLRAQSNPPPAAPPAPTKAEASSAAQTPSKKVWTNDNVKTPEGQPEVSTFQPENRGTSQPDGKLRGKSAAWTKNSNKDAKRYQDQIAKLKAKVPPLDAQIAELQAAIKGEPTGDAKSSTRPRGVKADSWASEMAQLQKQRDDIFDKIAALQDEARHNGVSPNALP
jgi:cell division protein FtsB